MDTVPELKEQITRAFRRPPTPGSEVRRVLMTADAVGGVWQYSLELAAGLARRDVEVALAVLGPAPDRNQWAEARTVPRLSLFQRTLKLEWMDDPWRDLATASDWLLDIESNLQPDLVHLNSYAHGALPWKSPVVVAGHSCMSSWFRAVRGTEAPGEWNEYRRTVAAGLAAADCVVAPTKAMLAELSRYGAAMRRTAVIPNSRDPRKFSRSVKRDFIFTAGRLWDPGKNVALLDRIAPRLAHTVFAAGPDRSPDGSPARFNNLMQLGSLDSGELARWLGMAAVYAAPARYEPFGLTPLEAALSGCAIVLGDIPSQREVWGPAASYAPPDDEAEWVRILNWMTADPARLREAGARARRHALLYNPDRMAESYIALYRELRAARAPRDAARPRKATP